jgi:hypothetical protein
MKNTTRATAKQTGWRHHEWGVVAQTPMALIEADRDYIEVAFCALCRRYLVYPSGKITAQRPELPKEYWL